ncbi:mTERF [Toxoplasma gondii p89]|uniref:mTERF n=1 Tax=Toxoplasma gondii p89 TaxID=943119 RepID=A0A086JFC4_TOXGO|nr:mTERF [Toxoplasma gondii p89]
MADEDTGWDVRKRRRDKETWSKCRICMSSSLSRAPPSSRPSPHEGTRALRSFPHSLHRKADALRPCSSSVCVVVSPVQNVNHTLSSLRNFSRHSSASRLPSCSTMSSPLSLFAPSPPCCDSLLQLASLPAPPPSSLTSPNCTPSYSSCHPFSSLSPVRVSGAVSCSILPSFSSPASGLLPAHTPSVASTNFATKLSSFFSRRLVSSCSSSTCVASKKRFLLRRPASVKARRACLASLSPAAASSVSPCPVFPPLVAFPVFLFFLLWLFSSRFSCAEALRIGRLGNGHRPPGAFECSPCFVSSTSPAHHLSSLSEPFSLSSLSSSASPASPSASPPSSPGPHGSSLGPKVQLGAPKYRKRAVRAGRQKTPKFPYSPKHSIFYDFPAPPADLPLPPSVLSSSATPEKSPSVGRAEEGGACDAEGLAANRWTAPPPNASQDADNAGTDKYLLRVPPIDQRARRMLWIHRHLGRRDGTLSPVEDEITDLLLSHNVPEETTLDLNSPLAASGERRPSSASSPVSPTTPSSPYLAHLHRLAFADTLGLTAAELTRLITLCPELLLSRRLAACSDSIGVLLTEKNWRPEAVKRLLLHVPRALTAGPRHLVRWMEEYRELFFPGNPEMAQPEDGARSDRDEGKANAAQREEADAFLEAVVLKHPTVVNVRRPKSKLVHFLKILRQVRATRGEFKPAGWSILPLEERARIVAFIASASPALNEAEHSDKRDQPCLSGREQASEGSGFSDEYRREQAADLGALELEWYRGHYERLDEFEGEKVAEDLASRIDGEGEEAREKRETILRPLREDAARMRAAMNREEASVQKMFRDYPRLFSFGMEGSVRSKLLYLQNCMHKELEEVFLFPQFLSYSLRRRIIPRHIALVNAFLLRERARLKRDNPLYEEGKTLERSRKNSQTRKRWDDRMHERTKLKLRLEHGRGRVAEDKDEGSVYDEEYWEKKAMLEDQLVPVVDERKGWRGLEPYQPFAMPHLPSLREMYATSDEKFMELFDIPYPDFVSAKVDAEKVKNPQTLF